MTRAAMAESKRPLEHTRVKATGGQVAALCGPGVVVLAAATRSAWECPQRNAFVHEQAARAA